MARSASYSKQCSINDCDRILWSRGWCLMHYKHWWRHGDVSIRKCAPNGNRKNHPLYSTYTNMIARCCSEVNAAYKDYGGRGITVGEDWLGVEGFDNFVRDMGGRPKGMSLERVDNNEGYSKDNCKWATPYEQSLNRRKRNDNRSGTVGVCWISSKRKWTAYIKRDGHRHNLGAFTNKNDAIRARKRAEAIL